ncbi:hypothetical protein POM88_000282 [Heracleum sosnowskyi]|uniref:Uncharacterized protein n=1 Tax=Heracleum sosnowskyi TaxID=360622 RepID=A0AAD8JE09_9APIA|nr:hypothetical protein POM88_000282 [Heracleum sosnowskyi]
MLLQKVQKASGTTKSAEGFLHCRVRFWTMLLETVRLHSSGLKEEVATFLTNMIIYMMVFNAYLFVEPLRSCAICDPSLDYFNWSSIQRNPQSCHWTIITSTGSHQLPLYGGVPDLIAKNGRIDSIFVPLNLTISIRSRTYVLGKLVKPKFYRTIRCQVTLHGSKLGKPVNLQICRSCLT